MLDCLLGLVMVAAARFDYFPPEPERETLTLAFTGDNKIEGRTVRWIAEHGEAHPYAEVVYALSAADFAFGNLECPITDATAPTAGKSLASIQAGRNFVFKADPAYSARILASAGFDVLSLANNHMMDYRAAGLEQTRAELEGAGLVGVGAGLDSGQAAQPVILEQGGIKVAYLAFSLIVPALSQAGPDKPGINTLSQQYAAALSESITPLQSEVDVIVCSFHWGQEGSPNAARYQRDIAHSAIDAGADLVIGHHPHCLQGFEFYEGGFIAYSLGNFLFTGPNHKLASCMLEVDAGPGGIACVRLLPVWLYDGRPEPAADSSLLRQLGQRCRGLELTPSASHEGWYELSLSTGTD